MYSNPAHNVLPQGVDEDHALEVDENQQHIDDFFEDVYYEMRNFGKVEELKICANTGPHLWGNVYVKFRHEDDAQKALANLTGRFYAGKPIIAEFSPVTDFREACCRQYDSNECTRFGECNFMHLYKISPRLYKDLMGRYPRDEQSRGRGREDHWRHDRSDDDKYRHGSSEREDDRETDRGHHRSHHRDDDRHSRRHRDDDRHRSEDRHSRRHERHRSDEEDDRKSSRDRRSTSHSDRKRKKSSDREENEGTDRTRRQDSPYDAEADGARSPKKARAADVQEAAPESLQEKSDQPGDLYN